MIVAYAIPSSADFPEGRLLAVHRGFKDRKLLEAADIQPGERHQLKLRPFEEMPTEIQSLQVADDTGEFLPLFWVERWERLWS